MGLFAKRSKSDAVEAIAPVDTAKADEQEPAVSPTARSRGFLRKRSNNDAQDVANGHEPALENDSANQSKKKGWLGRKSKDGAPPPVPPQSNGRVSGDQATSQPKGGKRNWLGRKSKDSGTEDDTSIAPAEIVAPKPPPRVRTPEEVAAGLERQKLAINAIRNTPEKRAATRAAAPIEIPSTTSAAGVSTAPVDTSGANRPLAPANSGGKLKGMFKGKVPSVPGFKSKRTTAVAGDGAVVSSAPVEVSPDATSSPAADGGEGSGGATASSSSPPVAPERSKSGGRFSGMFKRNSSGKAKKSKAKGKSGTSPAVPDEVELTDQVDNVHLSEEPVLAGEPTRQYPEVVHQVPAQQFPPAAASSGIITQEYSPVLPHTARSSQHSSNGFAQSHRSSQPDSSSFTPSHRAVNGRGPEADYYPEAGGSYQSAGVAGSSSNGYGHAAGPYEEESDEDAAWEHVNRTWNRA